MACSRAPGTAPGIEAKTTAQARLKPRVYIQVGTPESERRAPALTKILRDAGFVVPDDIEHVKALPRQPEMRYFRPDDADEAKRAAGALSKELPNIRVAPIAGYETSKRIRPGHLELWF